LTHSCSFWLNRRGPDFSQLAAGLDDMKIQLRTWFSCSNVKACRREANRVVHELAFFCEKLSRPYNVSEAIIWDNDVPAHVASVVVGDMPQVS
jgi:hypothetical protein